MVSSMTLSRSHLPKDTTPETWNWVVLDLEVRGVLTLDVPIALWMDEADITPQYVRDYIVHVADDWMAAKARRWGEQRLRLRYSAVSSWRFSTTSGCATSSRRAHAPRRAAARACTPRSANRVQDRGVPSVRADAGQLRRNVTAATMRVGFGEEAAAQTSDEEQELVLPRSSRQRAALNRMAMRAQQDTNHEMDARQPRLLAASDAPVALDQCRDLPDRHAAVRDHRNHAQSCRQIESKPQVTATHAQRSRLTCCDRCKDAKRCGEAAASRVAADMGRASAGSDDRRPRRRMVARRFTSSLPRPGGDAWLAHRSRRPAKHATRAPTAAGSPISTTCTRAVIPGSRGRSSSMCSRSACVVFCLTGLVLLQLLRRPAAFDLAAGRPWARDPATARDLLHSLR